jgi:uncharacterized protein (TIGR00730 family)
MTKPPPLKVPDSLFPTARAEAPRANQPTAVPQTEHPAYRLAFQDDDFLLREELRPVRFQLELLKPEMALNEAGITSTFVFYGSARIPSPEQAEAVLAAARTPGEIAVAERLAAKSHYYEVARTLAQLASCADDDEARPCLTVCSGGGPSIMEAANRGAWDKGAPSLGLNIVLPHEQVPNPYVTPGLSFQFHYFALRKMHFLMRAKAVAVFPGGFGTLDEMFELLTLVQTGKMAPLPILLYGRDFWNRVIDFKALAEEGVIAPRDLELFHMVETAEEGWAFIKAWYSSGPLDD